ncbi:uroporphyrinogen-III C-methyltransferase [Mucilaginibacter lappiensis]|jgi:uroporphyrin-III C-methyltransferase|uniref:uroporphyrinogen-III C-methyltransferase n=1 Tax=Mucilaginibacter lappiensis TaxID=354630 RepID=UPI003D2187A0
MENKTPFPELFVLGAGPGDPELITVKGYKILQQANVILYDNLANKALLDIAKADCEKIYVGKHPYGSYTPQETIHEMIKHYAFTKGSVVRLKGGDPFIFGRGFEEIMYAREQGIKTHFIPGISSMQASGFLDIPLTHRAMSEGIWIITGTKKDGTLSADLKLAMQSNATVVIYMGMKQIDSITQTYVAEGRGQTPAAIIQHASLPHQKAVKGLVKDLPEMAAKHQLTYPAIIIIGEVAGLSA